jgi:hypothetical protein
MRWAGHVAYVGMRNVYKILAGKSEGKIPLGRHRHKCKDNIKMETGFRGVVLIHLAQDRDLWWLLVNRVINFLFP